MYYTGMTTAIEYTMKYFCQVEQKGYRCIPIDKLYGKAKHDGPPGIICYLCKKTIINQLGSPDNVYYYVLFRGYWLNGKKWASEDEANIPRYYKDNTGGGSLALNVYHAAMTRKGVSAIVVGMLDPADPNNWNKRIYFYCKADDFDNHHQKFGGLYPSRMEPDKEEIGYPNTIFQREDVFKSYHDDFPT